MEIQKTNCTNCAATLDWDGSYKKQIECTYCGTVFMPMASGMEEVWLMTDRVARARYEFKGTLDALAQDIRFEVMRGEDWSALDLAFVAETGRLLEAGVIRKLASFWAASPHPTIYRTLQAGELDLQGKRVPFEKGQDMVWACPMTRDRFELDLPVLIGDFQDQRVARLCGEMRNAMMGRMP